MANVLDRAMDEFGRMMRAEEAKAEHDKEIGLVDNNSIDRWCRESHDYKRRASSRSRSRGHGHGHGPQKRNNRFHGHCDRDTTVYDDDEEEHEEEDPEDDEDSVYEPRVEWGSRRVIVTGAELHADVFKAVMLRPNVQATLQRLRRIILHPLRRDIVADTVEASLTRLECRVLRCAGFWVTADAKRSRAWERNLRKKKRSEPLEERPCFVQLNDVLN